ALAFEAHRRPAIGAARYLKGYRAMDRRHGDRRAEHGLDQRHRDIDKDVFIFACEQRMRLDLDLEINLAGFRVFEAQLLASLDPGGDGDFDIAPVGEGHPMLAAARRFEEAHLDLLRLRIGGSSVLAVAAEEFRDDVVEPGAEASTARGAGTGADMGAPAGAGAGKAAAERTGTGKGVAAARMAEACLLGTVGTDLAAIVARTLLRIAEKIISGGDFLELGLDRFLAGIEIGVKLFRKLAVSAFDLVIGGAAPDAKHSIGVSHLSHFALNTALQQRLMV